MDVTCVVCEKKTHITKRCVWPHQPKPLMQCVGLGHPDLGFFIAQYAKSCKEEEETSSLGLVQVVNGKITADALKMGLTCQFPWGREWEVTPKGEDFLVQFPNNEKLEMMIGVDEFKLKGSNAYIKISRVVSDEIPVGRLWTVWATARGIPKEMRHFKGICEIGAMIGAVDNADMQLLKDKGIVRFLVDVRTTRPFPLALEYYIKPHLHRVVINIDSVVEKGSQPEPGKEGNSIKRGPDNPLQQERDDRDKNGKKTEG